MTKIDEALTTIYNASSSQKSKLIDAYLNDWLKMQATAFGDIGLRTLGHFMSYKHKTTKTLSKDAKGPHSRYKGHWAWKIACLVKLQGIDDSSFRHHEWYPSDMIDN